MFMHVALIKRRRRKNIFQGGLHRFLSYHCHFTSFFAVPGMTSNSAVLSRTDSLLVPGLVLSPHF